MKRKRVSLTIPLVTGLVFLVLLVGWVWVGGISKLEIEEARELDRVPIVNAHHVKRIPSQPRNDARRNPDVERRIRSPEEDRQLINQIYEFYGRGGLYTGGGAKENERVRKLLTGPVQSEAHDESDLAKFVESQDFAVKNLPEIAAMDIVWVETSFLDYLMALALGGLRERWIERDTRNLARGIVELIPLAVTLRVHGDEQRGVDWLRQFLVNSLSAEYRAMDWQGFDCWSEVTRLGTAPSPMSEVASRLDNAAALEQDYLLSNSRGLSRRFWLSMDPDPNRRLSQRIRCLFQSGNLYADMTRYRKELRARVLSMQTPLLLHHQLKIDHPWKDRLTLRFEPLSQTWSEVEGEAKNIFQVSALDAALGLLAGDPIALNGDITRPTLATSAWNCTLKVRTKSELPNGYAVFLEGIPAEFGFIVDGGLPQVPMDLNMDRKDLQE